MEMIESKRFSLLKCENIKPCMARYRVIEAKRELTPQQKLKEMGQWKLHFENQAVYVLNLYFKLLDTRQYKEAYQFLKGEHTYAQYNLSAFFYKSAGTIGHLEIFISIYEIMHQVMDCILLANTP